MMYGFYYVFKRCEIRSRFEDPEGPIREFTWARFVIQGRPHAESPRNHVKGAGKDIRIVGSLVTPWNDRRGHLLTPAMITGVFDSGVEILIIGTGVENSLKCPDEVQGLILQRGISRVLALPTPQACRDFNRLFREKARVALLAHGTC